MGIEVRLSDVDQLDGVLGLDADIVSLGSDACPYKVPDVETLKKAHDRIVERGKKFKVVTPFVTCNHYDEMVALVHALARWDAPVQVVCNDYGLLQGAREIWASSRLTPIAGVCLSSSYGQVVRAYEIADGFLETLIAGGLSEEHIELSKWILETLGQNSMYSRTRVKLLRDRFHVVGAEVQLVDGIVPSLARIRGLGLEVTVHVGRVICTMSRACATARFHEESPPACVKRCNKVSALHVRGISKLGIAASSASSEHEKRILDAMPTFYVHGNVIVRDAAKDPETVENDSLNHVLVDVRDQTIEELAALCEQWKNSGKLNQGLVDN